MNPNFGDPQVDHIEVPERCKYCGSTMPEDWEDQRWHEVTRKRSGETYYCCDACYWAEEYDGPLQDDRGSYGPTAEQVAEWRRLKS